MRQPKNPVKSQFSGIAQHEIESWHSGAPTHKEVMVVVHCATCWAQRSRHFVLCLPPRFLASAGNDPLSAATTPAVLSATRDARRDKASNDPASMLVSFSHSR